MRAVAWLAWLATLLAQAVAPAMKSSGVPWSSAIDGVDRVSDIGSQMLVVVAVVLSLWMLWTVGRDRMVPLGTRVALVAMTTIVVVLASPSARFYLLPFACLCLGLSACGLAVLAARQALRQSRSRMLGFVLMLISFASLLRLTSVGLASLGPESKPLAPSWTTQWLASGSVVVLGFAQLLTLAWLASRKKSSISVGTTAALVVCMASAWIAMNTHATSPAWQLFVQRVYEAMAPVSSLLPSFVDGFVGVLGPCVAVVALLLRGQMSSLVAGLALALTAGIELDVPGHALTMMLAALATILTVRDDKGMWEALLGHRLSTTQPSH